MSNGIISKNRKIKLELKLKYNFTRFVEYILQMEMRTIFRNDGSRTMNTDKSGRTTVLSSFLNQINLTDFSDLKQLINNVCYLMYRRDYYGAPKDRVWHDSPNLNFKKVY